MKRSQDWKIERLILQPKEDVNERVWIYGGLDPWRHLVRATQKRLRLGDVWTTKKVMEMGRREDVKTIWMNTARGWLVDNQPITHDKMYREVDGLPEVVEGWEAIELGKVTEILDMVRSVPQKLS